MTTNYPNLDQILVIIPVLNEELTITGVVQSLQSYGLKNILVVDNGSTDYSVSKAQNAGAAVIVEPTPGYGRACWRGLQQVTPDIKWILFCDGDGSDDLSPLPQFFAKMADFDLILGNRRATAAGTKDDDCRTKLRQLAGYFPDWLRLESLVSRSRSPAPHSLLGFGENPDARQGVWLDSGNASTSY